MYSKVSFRTENFIQNVDASKDVLMKNEKFDTVMCLGTTKWVQLNFGDIGITAMFLRVHSQLKKGGTFIFEPQSWKTYKQEKGRCQQFKQMVEGGIVLKPGLFIPYLEKIGFEMEKVVKIEKEKE